MFTITSDRNPFQRRWRMAKRHAPKLLERPLLPIGSADAIRALRNAILAANGDVDAAMRLLAFPADNHRVHNAIAYLAHALAESEPGPMGKLLRDLGVSERARNGVTDARFPGADSEVSVGDLFMAWPVVGTRMSDREMAAMLRRWDLTPCMPDRVIRWAIANRDVEGSRPLVVLGQVWEHTPGNRFAIVIHRNGEGAPRVELMRAEGPWNHRCIILAERVTIGGQP